LIQINAGLAGARKPHALRGACVTVSFQTFPSAPARAAGFFCSLRPSPGPAGSGALTPPSRGGQRQSVPCCAVAAGRARHPQPVCLRNPMPDADIKRRALTPLPAGARSVGAGFTPTGPATFSMAGCPCAAGFFLLPPSKPCLHGDRSHSIRRNHERNARSGATRGLVAACNCHSSHSASSDHHGRLAHPAGASSFNSGQRWDMAGQVRQGSAATWLAVVHRMVDGSHSCRNAISSAPAASFAWRRALQQTCTR
jgi:hypothetical protein